MLHRGEFHVLEEDSEEEIIQTATTVLRYERGQRTAIPEYGISDPALRHGGADNREIHQAIEAYEPRLDDIETSKYQVVEEAAETVRIEMGIRDV
jgi:predicted component of type VI protein secretion system